MTAVPAIPPIAIALFIAFVINGAFLFITSAQKPNVYQQKITQFFLFTTLLVCGNFIRSVALTEGAFTIAQKMVFLGGSLMYYTMFQFYSSFCKVKIPRALRHFYTFYVVVVCLALMTYDIGSYGLVFKTWELVPGEDGYLDMVYTVGPAMWAYRLLNIVFTISITAISVIYLKRGKSKKAKLQSRLLFLVMILSLVGYVLEFAFKGTTLFPFTLSLGGILLMVSVYKLKVYDLHDTVHVEAFESSKSGIIAIGDKDNTFMGANPLAMKLFPSLQNLSISDTIDKTNAPLLSKILDKEEKEFKVHDAIYEATIDDYPERGVKLVWLNDVTSQREYVELLQNYQEQLETEVAEKTEYIQQMQNRIILAMADVIENRDGNTGGHVKRTSKIVELIAKAMYEDGYGNVGKDFYKVVTASAPLHDIGKISISDVILNKPARFTDEEFEIMKTHSAVGADLVLKVFYGVESAAVIHVTESIARSHHEKWDGTGYPEHLKGEDIPLEARIMAIADVYDALLSKRCYKPPMPFEQAHAIMEESFGTHFDPSLKKYFDQCLREIDEFYQNN